MGHMEHDDDLQEFTLHGGDTIHIRPTEVAEIGPSLTRGANKVRGITMRGRASDDYSWFILDTEDQMDRLLGKAGD